MADASDSKSDGGNIVWVQVPPPAWKRTRKFLRVLFILQFIKDIKTIQCILEENEGTYTYTGDKNGSDNLEQIADFLNATDGVTDDTATAANYPAFYFAKNYSTKATNLGTIYESGWYLPSIAELLELFKEKAEVNAAIKAVGGNGFNNSSYWSSTQSNTDDAKSVSLSFNNGDGSRRSSYKKNELFMCAIREF